MAEAFGVKAPPPHLRERADIATAEHIANQIPAGGAKREALLGEMLESIIAGAIASCSEAHDAWLEAAAAEEEMVRARRPERTAGGAGGGVGPGRGRAFVYRSYAELGGRGRGASGLLRPGR
jgi:hypothetical protein